MVNVLSNKDFYRTALCDVYVAESKINQQPNRPDQDQKDRMEATKL